MTVLEGGGWRWKVEGDDAVECTKNDSIKIQWKQNVNGAKKGTKSALNKIQKVSEKVKKVKTKPFFNKIYEKF